MLDTTHKLQIGDKQIEYRVRRGNSRKYVHLRFKPNLELEVVLPNRANVTAESILKKKQAWIERKYHELLSSKRVFDGERILFKGRYLQPIIERVNIKRSKKPKITENTVTFYSDGQRDLREIVRKWMRNETFRYLRKAVPSLATKLSVSYSKLDVRDIKKWGYCTKRGGLSFNWQLIALPRKLAEYVILHELIHLSEFNHLKGFRKRLAAVCPDFKERETMLKRILPMLTSTSEVRC